MAKPRGYIGKLRKPIYPSPPRTHRFQWTSEPRDFQAPVAAYFEKQGTSLSIRNFRVSFLLASWSIILVMLWPGMEI